MTPKLTLPPSPSNQCLLGSPPEMVSQQSVYLYVNSNNPKIIKSTIRTFNYLSIV